MGSLAIARLAIIENLRRKEFYVVLVLVLGLAVWMTMLNMSASGTGRFAKDVVMQVTWLASFALAVPLAVRQIASDLEQKTVYVLASRPINRWHYVAGRTLGAAFASIACFTCLFLVLVLMLMAKHVTTVADLGLWQAFVLQIAALFMICSVAMLLSVVSSPGGAVTFSLLILAVMRYGGPSILNLVAKMPPIARVLSWTLYLLMPHFEFFNISQRIVHGWGPLPLSIVGQVVAYGLSYSFVVTAMAAVVFRRRCWLPKIIVPGAIMLLVLTSLLIPQLKAANPQDPDVLIQVLGGTADFAAEKAYREADIYFHAGFDCDCPDEHKDHHVEHEVKASDSVRLPLLKTVERLQGEAAPRIHRHLQGEEEKEVLPWFIAAVRLNPQFIDAWRTGSYWFYRTDNGHRAIAFISDGIKRNPSDYRLYLDRGILYHRIGEWDNAIKDLETARRLWKNDTEDSPYEKKAIGIYLRDCRAQERVVHDS